MVRAVAGWMLLQGMMFHFKAGSETSADATQAGRAMASGSFIFGLLYLTKVVLRPLRCVRETR
jgi:hypothetical protein